VYRFLVRSVVVASTVCATRLLAADLSPPEVRPAALEPPPVARQSSWGFDELRIGGAASVNDRPLSGYVQFEGLFSPLPAVTAYDPNISWLFSPRPLIGASISLQGKTNQVYAGLAWNVPIFGPLFAEVSFGGLVHDQTLFQVYPDRPTLMTRFLFRESIAIGYDINATWRVVAFADHGSNGNLGYGNQSINHVGLMLGAKFGPGADKAPVPPVPSVAAFSWAGPYLGVDGGVAPGRVKAVIFEPGAPSETTALNVFSVNLGGHIGYNWAIGRLVAGVESDISAQRLTKSISRLTPIEEQISVSSRWLATARARVGVDIDRGFFVQRMLLYATGGAAFTRIGKSYCNPAIDACFINGDVAGGWVTEGGTRTGRTAGAGFEVPLAPHASAKLEYLYTSFGTVSFANGAIRNDVTLNEQIVRGGISFGFAGR
jgi:opacity protein-like surface antigen